MKRYVLISKKKTSILSLMIMILILKLFKQNEISNIHLNRLCVHKIGGGLNEFPEIVHHVY